jgi:hypothetical protein
MEQFFIFNGWCMKAAALRVCVRSAIPNGTHRAVPLPHHYQDCKRKNAFTFLITTLQPSLSKEQNHPL